MLSILAVFIISFDLAFYLCMANALFFMSKLLQLPVIKPIVFFLKALKPPGFHGFSLYDLLEMYTIGIVKGALTSRAGSISFSFFMALFPFLLFILNLIPFLDLIPFIQIENFDQTSKDSWSPLSTVVIKEISVLEVTSCVPTTAS